MIQKILSRCRLSMPGFFLCASLLSAIALGTLALVADPAGLGDTIANALAPPKLTPIITLFVE